MLVTLLCRLCAHYCLEHVLGTCRFAEGLSHCSHVHSLLYAGAWSSARMSSCLQHSKQPLSRTWGKRGERIGEAKQPGPAAEAVVTRKGDGQHLQKITASFCRSSSTWKWSTDVGANRSTPGKALQAWIHSHGGEFTKESLEALHALQGSLVSRTAEPCFSSQNPQGEGQEKTQKCSPACSPQCARAYGRSQGLRLYTCSETHLGGIECSARQSMASRKDTFPQTCLAMLGGLLRHMLVVKDPQKQTPHWLAKLFGRAPLAQSLPHDHSG